MEIDRPLEEKGIPMKGDSLSRIMTWKSWLKSHYLVQALIIF